MSFRKSLFTAALFFTFSQTTFAAGWSGAAKIFELYPSPGNNGVLIKHESMVNPDSCGSSGYYLLSKNNALFTEIFALMVSVQVRQVNIRFQVSGCGGQNNLRPLINQVIAAQ